MSIRKVILSILLILVIGVAAFALSQSNETFRYPKIETNDIGQFPFGQELYLLIDMQVGAG